MIGVQQENEVGRSFIDTPFPAVAHRIIAVDSGLLTVGYGCPALEMRFESRKEVERPLSNVDGTRKRDDAPGPDKDLVIAFKCQSGVHQL